MDTTDPGAGPVSRAAGSPDASRDTSRAAVSPGQQPAAVTITVTPGGPYLVRGPVTIVTADGREVLLDRATLALCRCGATGRTPFCDGSHRVCATPPAEVDESRLSRP